MQLEPPADSAANARRMEKRYASTHANMHTTCSIVSSGVGLRLPQLACPCSALLCSFLPLLRSFFPLSSPLRPSSLVCVAVSLRPLLLRLCVCGCVDALLSLLSPLFFSLLFSALQLRPHTAKDARGGKQKKKTRQHTHHSKEDAEKGRMRGAA